MDHSPFPLFSAASRARLRPDRGLLRRVRRAVAAARRIPREELSPAGVWIEDHARFLLEEADALRLALRPAPRLPGDQGAARVLRLAREICRAEEGKVEEALILRVSREFFKEQEPTLRELYHLPQALSIALFEARGGVLSSCEEEEKLRVQAKKWAERIEGGGAEKLPQDPKLLRQIILRFSGQENAPGMQRMETLLKKASLRPEEILRRAMDTLIQEGQTAGALITSLRRLPALPFDRIRERLSPAARVLGQEETYRLMDAPSRGYYQQQAARLAKRLGAKESDVARAALALTEGKTGKEGQAGYYLIERADLIARCLRPGKALSFSPARRQGLFLLPLYGGAAAAFFAGVFLNAPWPLWPLIPLCASEIIRPLYYRLLRRFFPARMTPRLLIKRLNEQTRTLVAVPTLLTSPQQALRMARQLATLRCANPDPYLDFLLLADFADSAQEHEARDAEILRAGREGIDALNQSQGGGFFYLHRARQWDPGQRRFTGRERKRGALDMLNHLLTQGKTADPLCFASCDPAFFRDRYAYVITLDADTFLPPGAACQLVGAMAHPLQKGRVGVIQPRMEVAADRVRTRTQALLGGRGGVDVYHLPTQDIYQDVFGRGSFVGKGIYEPRLWMERLQGRLPKGRLLSHDLIEGETAGSALAADIVCYDGHPARLAGWQKRLHRWTRGDWQLLPFLWDFRLSLLSRHKIWDNLRRSLAPAAQAVLLLCGAALHNPWLFLLGLPWPLRGMERRLLFLPAKALTLLDAALRALYRQFISRRDLLSWITAAQAEGGGQPPLSCVLSQVLLGAGMTALSLLPGGFLPAVIPGLLWAVSPLLISFLDRPLHLSQPLTPAMAGEARALARDTWRFFEDHVTANTLFLPPDNVQLDPDKGPALRTSPTNAGLYLLSCVAARELGLITTEEMACRLSETLSTLEKLKKWKGHLYNWYDLTDGAPLSPRFVSTVDSGNLACCLIACAQACRTRLSEMAQAYQSLPARLDALCLAMDFSALFDPRAELFFVGWEEEKNRPSRGHYDLMASEARLTSFLAVMTGQVPLRHWARLDRSTARAGGGFALLS